jgi:hypothetical protein
MSDVSGGADWWVAANGKWYPPERHPDYVKPVVAAEPSSAFISASDRPAESPPVSVPPAVVAPVHVMQAAPNGASNPAYNQLHTVRYRGGWIGLFAGENQTKALQRAIPQLNASGLRVAGVVTDRWSFWKRLGVILLLIVTLGFVGRVPNVLLITEPIR